MFQRVKWPLLPPPGNSTASPPRPPGEGSEDGRYPDGRYATAWNAEDRKTLEALSQLSSEPYPGTGPGGLTEALLVCLATSMLVATQAGLQMPRRIRL